jgi:adenylyltransferase/sulfurtransferase
VLARCGLGHITVLDDDVAELSNLHRQVFYEIDDIGLAKAPVFARRVRDDAARNGFALDVVAREIRALPESAVELVTGYDLVLEGADNFASKFMIADACALMSVPVVQAGAVRWVGWVVAAAGRGGPCLRCVFEDVPNGTHDTCAAAGVIGPVAGVVGALQAAVALDLLSGHSGAAGTLWSYDGLKGSIRCRRVGRRDACDLCSGRITDTDVSRYAPPECAA